MRKRSGAVVAVLAVLSAAVVLAPAALARPASGPRVVFHLQDPRIDEASGIGVGVRSPGVDYVENDSGDVNRFFALDARTGATAAVVTVPDATNVDWEDLQVAPDAAGTPSVWLADIGDNDAARHEVDVYRVPEPRVDPQDDDVAVTAARPAVWRLRYPSGPTDAESLAVTPRGRAYIVTKDFLGESDVYRLPARPDRHRVRTMHQVGSIDFPAARGESPVGDVGSVLATSAAVSPDGRLLVVRTYAYALVWRLPSGGRGDPVAAALRTTPTRVTLPAQPQGEGVTFDRHHLLIDSEGVGTPVWSVPLPRLPDSGTAGSGRAGGATALTAGTPKPSSSASDSPSPSRTRSPSNGGRHFGGLSVLILALLIGGVVLLGRRARRFGDDGRR